MLVGRGPFLTNAIAYEQLILNRNPLGYWRQDDLAVLGGANDLAPISNTGTFLGNPAFGLPGAIVNDPDSYAIDYRSTTGLLHVPHHTGYDAAFASAFTFELWFKRSDSLNDRVLLCRWEGPSDRAFIVWFPSTGLQWLWDDPATQTFLAVDTGNSYADGLWHHMAIVYDNGDGFMYIDGSSVGTSSPNTIMKTTNNVIGVTTYSNIFLPGQIGTLNATIDELVLYGYALTSAQVLESYNKGLGI